MGNPGGLESRHLRLVSHFSLGSVAAGLHDVPGPSGPEPPHPCAADTQVPAVGQKRLPSSQHVAELVILGSLLK